MTSERSHRPFAAQFLSARRIWRKCSLCLRRVKRWTNAGRMAPDSHRTVRHRCPHGFFCVKGDPLWITKQHHKRVYNEECPLCMQGLKNRRAKGRDKDRERRKNALRP